MYPLPHYQRTRIAPTPSGYLHIGNVLSFIITASLAKRTGAKLFLRIDDLDQQRVRTAYVQDIFDTLRFLHIGWDEGPRHYHEFETRFAQIHRMNLYQRALQQLREGGHLFACTCSRTQVLQENPDGIYQGTCSGKGIPLDTPGVCWRLHTATLSELKVKNLNGSITTTFLPPTMQSFVVRKKDGYPAYQLTSLVDDLHYNVDLIVRGADLWPSTLAQLYLASLLGQEAFLEASFHHHPLILDVNGHKLSKSDGAQSILQLRKTGLQPSDIYALLTQSHAMKELDLFTQSLFVNAGSNDC